MKKIFSIIFISLLAIIVCAEGYFLYNQYSQINKLSNSLSSLNSKYIELNGKYVEISGQYEDQKNNEDEKLAEKVITEAYNQQKKAGSLRPIDNMYLLDIQTLRENMELIGNSYSGNDSDIKDMLEKIKKYLDYTSANEYKVVKMSKDDQNKYYNQSMDYYSSAKNAVRKCISKYALFDKIGLD